MEEVDVTMRHESECFVGAISIGYSYEPSHQLLKDSA